MCKMKPDLKRRAGTVSHTPCLCEAQVPSRGMYGYRNAAEPCRELAGAGGPTELGDGLQGRVPRRGEGKGGERWDRGEAGPIGEGKGRSHEADPQGRQGRDGGVGEEAPKEGRGRRGGDKAAADGLRERVRCGVAGAAQEEALEGAEEEIGASKTRPGGAGGGNEEIGMEEGNGAGPDAQK